MEGREAAETAAAASEAAGLSAWVNAGRNFPKSGFVLVVRESVSVRASPLRISTS